MFVALRDLRFARGRFALMGTVVTLITLLVLVLSGLTVGLGRGNTSAITGLPADHLVLAAPPAGQKLAFAESSLPASVQRDWARVPGVRSVDPVAVAMSRAAVGARTTGVATFAVPTGSPLAPGVAPGRVVLSAEAASALALSSGERLDLGGRAVTVAAIGGGAQYSHAPVVWVAPADAPATGQPPGAATFLAVTTEPGSEAALAAADARLGTVAVTPKEALAAIGSYASENGSLQLMRALLFVISALVVGAFFTVWTVQRSGEVAILKAIGASNGYLLRDALGQALVVLIAGTALGSALAITVGALIGRLGGTVPFVLDLQTVLVPALVLVALGLLGAAVALRSVTTVDPLTALGSAR